MPLLHPNGRLDRIGGRLLYRIVGIAFALIMLGTGTATLAAVQAGEYIAGAIFAAITAGLLWLVCWCFSPKRRLHETEWC